MKQLIFALLLVLAAATVSAQTGTDKLCSQAAAALESKEFVTARYYYLKAYQAFADAGDMADAVDCAVNAAALYHRENFYKEAFETLSRAEVALNTAELADSKPRPALHYPIARERQRMYLKLKRADDSAEQLAKMEAWAKQAANRDIDIDLLSSSAQQYFTFGQNDKGDAAINQLIALYLADGDYDKADECYKKIIDMALRTNNARLVGRSYEKYLAWNDSIAAVKANANSAELNKKYDDAQVQISSLDSSLTVKNGIIVGLCILAIALAVLLVLCILAWIRSKATIRRQKSLIDAARRRDEIHNRFIANIASQMESTLNTLNPADPGVKALKDFTAHIQTLASLEASRDEKLPTDDVNMSTFLESLAAEIQPMVKPGVTVTVNAPKMSAPIAEEQLREVLLHLLRNAAIHTPADGRITLDFKKRGPHNIQFMVTDSGAGIDEERRADLFVPFAHVADLREGDGLGLPTAALRTERMNGTLSLDTSWRQGTRFVVELHP